MREYIMFALIGLGLEVVLTGLSDSKKHYMGYSSLVYTPLYALTPLVLDVVQGYQLEWYYRGLVYALIIHSLEFIYMGGYKLIFRESPSEKSYRRGEWHIWGLTNLSYAPVWFLVGLILEYLRGLP